MKERYEFHINDKPGKPSQNFMVVSGWKIQDSDNDLLFYFVQRKCYNDVTRTNIIRTAAIQFANERGLDCLDQYYETSQNTIRRVDPMRDNLPDFLVGGNMTPDPDNEIVLNGDENDDGAEFELEDYSDADYEFVDEVESDD
jgi:hypothetical protein